MFGRYLQLRAKVSNLSVLLPLPSGTNSPFPGSWGSRNLATALS